MKKILFYFALLLLVVSCNKDEITNKSKINFSFITTDNNIKKVMNINPETTDQNSWSISCYELASSAFDPTTSSLGYADCNGFYKLIDPVTGVVINEFILPASISQTVIDPNENCLIGQFFYVDSNQIIKISLETGETVAMNAIHFNSAISTCSYFYHQRLKRYMLITDDNVLHYINPDNGLITQNVTLESVVSNGVFDEPNNRIIGLKYSSNDQKLYIETLNASTGVLISREEVSETFDYYACESDYDQESNAFIVVSSDNNIKFINVESGDVIESYQINYPVSEFHFWRNE